MYLTSALKRSLATGRYAPPLQTHENHRHKMPPVNCWNGKHSPCRSGASRAIRYSRVLRISQTCRSARSPLPPAVASWRVFSSRHSRLLEYLTRSNLYAGTHPGPCGPDRPNRVGNRAELGLDTPRSSGHSAKSKPNATDFPARRRCRPHLPSRRT